MYSGLDIVPRNGDGKPVSGMEPRVADEAAGVEERQAVFLHPGRIFVSPEPSTVRMVLGSCVAVCLWDPSRRTGGANHFLLPYQGSDSAEFGDVAIQQLIEKLLGMGCTTAGLMAKLFGGSCVLEGLQSKETHVGARNISLARKLLASQGIPIVAEDVGGQRGRRVIFQTDDGSAWVRRL
jgi:chemotaxis protein CheD